MLAKLEAARSVDDFRYAIRAIDKDRDALGLEASAKFTRMALTAISGLTVESPRIAADAIREASLALVLAPERAKGPVVGFRH